MITYRVTSDKNSKISRITSVFERTYGGPSKSWIVTAIYDQAQAFADDLAAPTIEDHVIICDTRLGYHLGRPVELSFTFDDAISEEDRAKIQSGWEYAQSYGIDYTRWIIEEDYIRISGPKLIELVDDERIDSLCDL